MIRRENIWPLTSVLCFLLFSTSSGHAQQVTLQPWMQVYGTVGGQEWGRYVTGIEPSANLPYRAAVSRTGRTGFFTLSSQSDTAASLVLPRESPFIADVNGDGWTDILLSSTVSGYDTVIVHWGTETGVGNDSLVIPGDRYDDLRPACFGDVNNDGYDDLVMRAPGYGPSQGRVSFHFGPSITATPDAWIDGDSALSHLGEAVCIGDINDDSLNDLIVKGWNTAGPQSGRYDYVRIYWGLAPDTINLTYDVELRGYNLNSAGLACFDVNGDEIDDLLWTTFVDSTLFQEISVHFGRPIFETTRDLVLTSPFASADNIQNAGDMNNDGWDDILVGAPRATITSGFVYVYGGGPQIDGEFDAAVGMSTDSDFGWSTSGVGDLNGDGIDDIIVGAPNYWFGNDKGYWGIFLGDDNMIVSDVDEVPTVPEDWKLYPAYPNPFNPATTIRYSISRAGGLSLKIFNLLGEEVTTLVSGHHEAGTHTVQWDATGEPSGVYFYRLQAGDFVATKKLVLVR